MMMYQAPSCRGFTPVSKPAYLMTTTTTNSITLHVNHIPTRSMMISQPNIQRTAAAAASKTTLFGMFGNKMFGGGSDTKENAVLGTFDIPASLSTSTTAFESLSDYLQNKWARLLVDGNIALTTPVKVESIGASSSPSSDDDDDEDVKMVKGVRLLFQKVNTGYQDKEREERKKESKDGGDDKKKRRVPSQGGVEILVEQLKSSGQLRVRARRCAIDEETVIKEMSEETIVRELQTAIDVWKKDSK